MDEAPQLAKALAPPAIKKMTGNKKGPAQEAAPGVEQPPANEVQFAPKKKKPQYKLFTLDLFEATIADAKVDINLLFTQYAEFLSMKATADNSQMKELEGILREARKHESYLKEKKKHLTQTLALISEKLEA